VPGATPLHILQQSQATQNLTSSMGSMSVTEGPKLPPCQPDDAVLQLQEVVARALKRTPFTLTSSPGAAILVISGGQTIVRHCWGLENIEAGRPVTEHTVFDLASLGKQFTALAVVRLVGEGRVSLSSPISAYIKDFAPTPKSKAAAAWSHVTVQHLLHHTSGQQSSRACCTPLHINRSPCSRAGLPDYTQEDWANDDAFRNLTPEGLLQASCQCPRACDTLLCDDCRAVDQLSQPGEGAQRAWS
jgi:CubicO group peptidase (beta-lactamase class C family)